MKGVKDFLVDFTGGWSKLTEFTNNKEMGFDENKKKVYLKKYKKH